jgi:excisionase family DNA binding protein
VSDLQTVLAELRAMREQLDRAVAPPPALLSKAAAAEMLGVSRNATMTELIRSGRLRTVTVGARVRIPLAEVERLTREGLDAAPAQRKAPPRTRHVKTDWEAASARLRKKGY